MLGALVRGSIGVTFDVPIDVRDLGAKAREVLQVSRKSDYKDAFPFVDYVQPVDDEGAEELDHVLSVGLNARSESQESGFRCLYLAAPEVLNLEEVEGFIFSSEWGAQKTARPELDLDDYIETRVGRTPGINAGTARKDRVLLRLEGQVDRSLASVYRCLIAEVAHDGLTYQLVDGRWYSIEPKFVARIREHVAALPVSPINFPSYTAGEDELTYNARAAQDLGALLLDRRNIALGGGANRIEVCDFALPDRTLVHAKKRSASSTLSHLWTQGTVSLDALLGDPDFRARVLHEIAALNPMFTDIVGDDLTGPDYSVVYLIIGVDHTLQAWEALPFFSQVALAQAARTLSNMGAQVALASA